MELKDIISHLEKAKNSIKKFQNFKEINEFKIKYLSRNGEINNYLKKIKTLQKQDKKFFGETLNNFKVNFEINLNKKKKEINCEQKNNYFLDLSLPEIGLKPGSIHLINKTINEVEEYFSHIGFEIINGIEIDNIFNNFTALNIKKNHPSRSHKDTFYISDETLLRTHTSNMQIHIMKNSKPPFKILSYGKVYRRDYDTTHTPMFHQAEGFIVNKNISLGNLKYLLINFLNYFFENKIKTRIRPSYFPFTEPSLEIDIECVKCFGKKCSICNFSGWIEILGCGMIHKKIISNCNLNSKLNGFAFGLGIERMTMIKHRIDDLRIFFENNIEFLNQF